MTSCPDDPAGCTFDLQLPGAWRGVLPGCRVGWAPVPLASWLPFLVARADRLVMAGRARMLVNAPAMSVPTARTAGISGTGGAGLMIRPAV